MIVVLFTIFAFVRIFSPATFHSNFASWANRFGFYDVAIDRYSMAIRSNSNNPGAFNSRGVARFNTGQYQTSIEDYSKAIQLDPQFASAFKNRALSNLFFGKGKEAIIDYENACKLNNCVEITELCEKLNARCANANCLPLNTALSVGICSHK
jgi:tetratricopeptide (TPR) repeat protein